AQRSVIKRKTSASLGLPQMGKEQLEIFSFGHDAPIKQSTKRVKVVVNPIGKRNPKIIEVLEIENLGCELTSVPNSMLKNKVQSMNLELADRYFDNTGCSEVELIIGADYYGDFVHNEQIVIDGALRAVNTVLGWTLMGPSESGMT